MYCNGVDNLELVSLVADLGDILANLVPNNPDDFENGGRLLWLWRHHAWTNRPAESRGSDDTKTGRPDGWTEDGSVRLRADMQSGTLTAERIQRLWINSQLGE